MNLLKRLSHPNIVQFYGFEKSETSLSIFMEYCESGSLHDTMLSFGAFPETLVCTYLRQVLLGLEYLHAEGIVHRDIKSGNILSTKEGIIKLADFGIATAQDNTKGVFEGSPYWVAPEVIELSGSSTASDIWSVGCTAIELFTTKPPYYELEPVSALFRIATDPSVPYPSGISALFKSFLDECFQRDKNLRIDAARLLRHAWFTGEFKTNENIPQTFPKASDTVPNLEKFMDSISSHYSGDFEDIQELGNFELSVGGYHDNFDLLEFHNFPSNPSQGPSFNDELDEMVRVGDLVEFIDRCCKVQAIDVGTTIQKFRSHILTQTSECW
jgi:serine/threonine protein kinase